MGPICGGVVKPGRSSVEGEDRLAGEQGVIERCFAGSSIEMSFI